MGRVAESITDLKQAVELEQSKPESHNNLGLSYLELGRLEDAVEHFSTAIQLDQGGDTAIYYNNRGLSYLRMEKLEACFQDLDLATQLNPNDPNYFFNRGNAYLTVKNVEQALSDLDEAISLAHSIPAYYHSKGVAFQALALSILSTSVYWLY
jgi:tetratricopeptide (TPR) repeat protein